MPPRYCSCSPSAIICWHKAQHRMRMTADTQTTATSPVTSPPRHILRGWFHAGGALASIIFTTALVWGSAYDCPRWGSMLGFGFSMASKSNSRPPGAARLFHQPNENARFAGEPRQDCANVPGLTTGRPRASTSSPRSAHCRPLRVKPACSRGLPATS